MTLRVRVFQTIYVSKSCYSHGRLSTMSFNWFIKVLQRVEWLESISCQSEVRFFRAYTSSLLVLIGSSLYLWLLDWLHMTMQENDWHVPQVVILHAVSSGLRLGKHFARESSSAERRRVLKRAAPFVLLTTPTAKSLSKHEEQKENRIELQI